MFDVNNFLNQSVVGPLSTKIPVVPVGDYRARVDKLEVREAGEAKILRITWRLIDAAELSAIGRESATVRQDAWLDLDENDSLDTAEGKNVSLGRVFEALGMNEGERVIGNIMGQVAIVKVGHRADKTDSSKVYDEVQRVAALS